ncbi:hypothetical protein NPX13_g1348 [Xylaria arbuscula]|uniref:Uncharacterized protein n=1 Tax=Xylaria arbuscula TaxID=114810 RepID=A0A9W8NMV4_9PEZI|nr:hypothetical protein NPX13_g1348 [Xylaria arbuscula]
MASRIKPATVLLSRVTPPARCMATMSSTQAQPEAKREGNIADSFVSLSGGAQPPLPERFLELKKSLVAGREDRVIESWNRLLARLKHENSILAKDRSQVIPSLEFSNFDEDLERLGSEIKKRGVAVVRGVIPEKEARSYKNEIEEYVKQNPWTKGKLFKLVIIGTYN